MSVINRLPTLPQINDELAELSSRRRLLKQLKAAIQAQQQFTERRAKFFRSIAEAARSDASLSNQRGCANANSPDSR